MNFKKITTITSVLLFVVYLAGWIFLELKYTPEDEIRNYYSLSYGILAAYGGFLGFGIAKKWEGFKSVVGKSLIFFAFGLLCQFLGQTAYAIQYQIDGIENSYPSWGEIFFFISMPSYIAGVWYIAKASGSWAATKGTVNRLISFVVPITMVVVSYYMFINGSDFTGQSVLAIALSFAYPIGQAIFVSLAIIAYFLASKTLGGLMRTRVFFILFSLVFQYIADSVFLYKTIQGSFYHADFSEFLFAMSYSVMTFAFLQFEIAYDQVSKKK